MLKKLTKLLSLFMVFTIFFGTSAVGVHAANYTAVNGGTTTLTKYLVVNKDATLPSGTFNFTIASGTPVEATATTVKVWAGNTPNLVKIGDAAGDTDGNVVFTGSETTTDGPLTGIASNTQKYASHNLIVDFTGVSFAEPGVYRYILTETAAASGSVITNDPVATRTIDVYVEDNNGSLEVTKYAVYSGTVTAGPATAGTDTGTKSDSYVNTMDTNNLSISKTVSGNQGSKDQYFAITATITGLTEGYTVNVDMSGAETAPVANAATSYTAAEMATANNVQTLVADSEGTISHVFYLKHNQTVEIKGIASGKNYTVVETDPAAGYTKSGEVSTATALNADAAVAITNTRNGTIPTGIIMKILPYAVLFAIAAGAIVINSKKTN